MTRPFLAVGLAASVLLCQGIATAQRPGRPSSQRPSTRRPGDMRTNDKLKVGDRAPDFTLKTPDGKKSVTLSEHKGNRPVALVFGSYT